MVGPRRALPLVPAPPPEESSQFARCGGLLARGRRPRRLPSRVSPQPVAFAADSPLTVAGAAPVSHRTSLSHRKIHASTRRHAAPFFSAEAALAFRGMGGSYENRGWLPVRQGALFGRGRAGVCRRMSLQELPEGVGNRLCGRGGGPDTDPDRSRNAKSFRRPW